MPTYTYTCTTCHNHVEKRRSFSDPPLTTCEQCGGTLRKIIHPVGIVFKGSGWYSTDSRVTTPAPKAAGTPDAGEPASATSSKDGASSSKEESSGGDKADGKDKPSATKDAGSKSGPSAASTSPNSASSSKSGSSAEKS